MDWKTETLSQLQQRPVCGYAPRSTAATEPTALTALALIGHGARSAALPAIRWLRKLQANDGSLGVREDEPTPRWPTSLAALAWQSAGQGDASSRHRAINWILGTSGRTFEPVDEIGHDPSILAWSWVEDTHSWIEPTAMHVLALKAAGHSHHNRTRQAIRMLQNRLLPEGGCNYGNTSVLGQTLRPHVMPTGLALLALAGEHDPDGRIERSLKYLSGELSARTSAASLAYGLMALAAHGRLPERAPFYLAAAHHRTVQRNHGGSPYRLALLALAWLGETSPLITIPRAGVPA